MFEEEGSWFLKIKDEYDNQAFLTHRFREEYERYVKGSGLDGARAAGEPRSFGDGAGESPAAMI